jgi:hypothetical protein
LGRRQPQHGADQGAIHALAQRLVALVSILHGLIIARD